MGNRRRRERTWHGGIGFEPGVRAKDCGDAYKGETADWQEREEPCETGPVMAWRRVEQTLKTRDELGAVVTGFAWEEKGPAQRGAGQEHREANPLGAGWSFPGW